MSITGGHSLLVRPGNYEGQDRSLSFCCYCGASLSPAGQGLEGDTETQSGITTVHKGTGRADVSEGRAAMPRSGPLPGLICSFQRVDGHREAVWGCQGRQNQRVQGESQHLF